MARQQHGHGEHGEYDQRRYYSDVDQRDGYHNPDEKIRSWRSRTSSAGRRSRKTSASNRELMRVLVDERLDSERLQEKLLAAEESLASLTRRASDAERDAVEAKVRLQSINKARISAQLEAGRAIAELRLYKTQYAEAQSQIERANELIRQSDAERLEAEKEAERARKAARKYRDEYLTHRTQEEGRRLGREEGRRIGLQEGMTTAWENARRLGPLDEEAEEATLRRRRSLEPIDEVASPTSRASVSSARTLHAPVPQRPLARTLRSATAPIPDTMSSRQRSTPSRNTQRYRSSTPDGYNEPRLPPRPDHIIVRSPAVTPNPADQRNREMMTPSRDGNESYSDRPRHARHQSMPATIARSTSSSASESASLSSPEMLVDSLSRTHLDPRTHERRPSMGQVMEGFEREDGVADPNMYTAVPSKTRSLFPFNGLLPPTSNNFSQPHPVSSNPHVNFASSPPENYSNSDSGTSSTVDISRPPSRAASTLQIPRGPPGQLRREDRRWSSSGHVPQITILPPSRSESADTVHTMMTVPHLLSPEHAFHVSMLPGVGLDGTPLQAPPIPLVHEDELPPGFMPTELVSDTGQRDQTRTPVSILRRPRPVDVAQDYQPSFVGQDSDHGPLPTAQSEDFHDGGDGNRSRPRSDTDYFSTDHHRSGVNQFRDPASLSTSSASLPEELGRDSPPRSSTAHSLRRQSNNLHNSNTDSRSRVQSAAGHWRSSSLSSGSSSTLSNMTPSRSPRSARPRNIHDGGAPIAFSPTVGAEPGTNRPPSRNYPRTPYHHTMENIIAGNEI